MRGLRALLTLAALASPTLARADMSFHVVEILSEDEVRPLQAHHVTRWEGDYYVTDEGVSALGWGKKGGGTSIPFDQPHQGTTPEGSAFTSVFHRLHGGFEVTITYDSYVLWRRILQTGPASCSLEATMTLRPGHDLFEVHRVRNHEPMADARRSFTGLACSLPKLLS